jgi:hypothetical protein
MEERQEAVMAKSEVSATHVREWMKENHEIREGSDIRIQTSQTGNKRAI